MRTIIIGSLLGAFFGVAPVTAQQTAPSVPQVVTVGRGDVDIKPDRAQVLFSVETRASTAATAAAENSRPQLGAGGSLEARPDRNSGGCGTGQRVHRDWRTPVLLVEGGRITA